MLSKEDNARHGTLGDTPKRPLKGQYSPVGPR
jgi:hypothetical protein